MTVESILLEIEFREVAYCISGRTEGNLYKVFSMGIPPQELDWLQRRLNATTIRKEDECKTHEIEDPDFSFKVLHIKCCEGKVEYVIFSDTYSKEIETK